MRLLALVCALPAAWAQPLPSAWDVPLPPLQLQSSQRLQEEIPASARGQQPVYLAADRFEGQTDLRAQLQGQVELRRGDTVIRAEQAEYTVANDTVTAQGNVHINRGGNIYQGTQLQLQVDAFQGDFTEATYQFLDTQGHGDAQRVQFFSRERLTIHEATYTTCQRDDSTSWAPDWVLQAERMELDRATDTGVAYDAVLKFKGVPILPVPVVSFPLSDRRKSGLLPPTIGIDSVSGVEYAQPYYWNIAPNRDATLTPDVMLRRGVDLGGEFRRQFSLLPDRGEDRGAPLLQFAQVGQALVERAQLRVVEPAGGFLAVAGDEGHRGALVEQADGGGDLGQGAADFLGDFPGDAKFSGGCHRRFFSCEKGRTVQNRVRKLKSRRACCGAGGIRVKCPDRLVGAP